MLIEFRVSNYRSIGEEQVISLVPAPKQKDYPQNIIEKGRFQALNAISLYGPNGGGKSNLLKAMSLLDKMVSISARTSSTSKLPYDPFLLKEGMESRPTGFEILFVAGEERFRFGFEFNETEIVKEWLFKKGNSREVALYERENDTIQVSNGFKGNKKLIDAAIEATRSNSLFISTCDMLNVDEAKRIMQWFAQFSMVDGLNTEGDEMQMVDLWENPEFKPKIKRYLSSLGLNVKDVEVSIQDFDESQLPDEIPDAVKSRLTKVLKGSTVATVMALHQMYSSDNTPVSKVHSWKWEERESSGAQKALQLSGPVLWTLENGGVLIIDEVEAKMHPILTLHTIEAFLNPGSNPNNAQLIFSTHDTNLLTYAHLRRDQICFAEKNNWESTEVYSLSDFVYFGERNGKEISEKERPDTDKEKRYIEGRYGAIPALGAFRDFLTRRHHG